MGEWTSMHQRCSKMPPRRSGGNWGSTEECMAKTPDDDKNLPFMLGAFAGTLDPRANRALQQQAKNKKDATLDQEPVDNPTYG